MKKIILLFIYFFVFICINKTFSQVFWTETFSNGCSADCLAQTYTTGPNGAWTVTSTGTNDPEGSVWFISCKENGNASGSCGTDCSTSDPSLHVGSNPTWAGDLGAAYEIGGWCGVIICVTANLRAESPIINCTGKNNITLSYNYIEYGDGINDNATLWYWDGALWSQLADPAKTACCGGPCNSGSLQGLWTAYSIVLPSSADNNPNVKIGFNWTNNDDGVGWDPSFAVDDIELSVPGGAMPVADFSSSDSIICIGSCINFTDLSTNSPTTWSWTFNGATPGTSTTQSPSNICYNTAGTYTVTLVATNGFGSDTETKTSFITVVATPAVSVSPSSPSICSGGSTSLTAGGASNYSWSPATGLSSTTGSIVTANPAMTTTYTVTGNTSGCTGSTTVTVTVNTSPTISVTPSPASYCTGGSVSLSASGATSYSWSPSSGLSCTSCSNPTANPAATITYTVTGTSSGCTGTSSITVTVNPLPTVSVTPNPVTICSGNSTVLNASGALTYSWSPATGLSATSGASVTANPLLSITYTITGTDSNGCSNTTDVAVTVTSAITANAGTDTSLCSGSSVTLSATGGSSYAWSPSSGLSCTNCQSPVANPTSTTTYTVTVSSGSCTPATDDVTVTVNPVPSANAGNDVIICNGDNTTLSASGGGSYSWNPSAGLSCTNCQSPVASPASTTTYVVTVTGTGNCTATDDVIVTVSPTIIANAGTDTSFCAGSGVQLSASGGTSYSWSPSTGLSCTNCQNPLANPSSTTTYTVTVSSGSCTPATDDVTVTVNPLPVANAGNDVSICNGDNTTLSASGGTSYNWSPAAGLSCTNCQSPVASPTTTTTYIVTVTGTGNCTADDDVLITVTPAIIADAGPDTTICTGDSILLPASGGTNYSWSPSSGLSCTNCQNPLASPFSTTTYVVTVGNGSCTPATDAVIVTVVTIPVASVSGDTLICFGDNTVLTASGAGTFSWSSGQTTASISLSPVTNTTYTVTVSNGGLCTDAVSITITVMPIPNIHASNDTTIDIGTSAQLNTDGGIAWTWAPDNELSCTNCQNPSASPTETTTYHVTITDSSGCTVTDSVIVTIDMNCGDVFVPNAFSPNYDGNNDTLYVFGNCIEILDFAVYDRWGELVFSTQSVQEGWDGTYKGNPMNSGVFVYYLKAQLYDDTLVSRHGDINLFR